MDDRYIPDQFYQPKTPSSRRAVKRTNPLAKKSTPEQLTPAQKRSKKRSERERKIGLGREVYVKKQSEWRLKPKRRK